MKKLLLLLVVAIISAVSASADDTTCRVYGTNNVATLSWATAVGSSDALRGGNHYVTAKVELTERAEKNISVVVNVSDGNRTIASGVVSIPYYNMYSSVTIEGPAIRAGETYYLSIAGVSCQ